MAAAHQLVVFRLDETGYALYLDDIDRVVRVAEWTPLPHAPPIVLGVLDIEGRIVPLLDPRRRFGLAPKPLSISDQLIIARAAKRQVALLVDRVDGVVEARPEMLTATGEIVPDAGAIEGVMKLGNDIVLIHDLAKFLSLEEATALDEALSLQGSEG